MENDEGVKGNRAQSFFSLSSLHAQRIHALSSWAGRIRQAEQHLGRVAKKELCFFIQFLKLQMEWLLPCFLKAAVKESFAASQELVEGTKMVKDK